MADVAKKTEVLTDENVDRIFQDCLVDESKGETGEIHMDGIIHKAAFHRERLQEHTDEIFAMLLELPSEFMVSGGGGWSFLNACVDKNGRQWTGQHLLMEELFLMGLAIEKVKLLMPRPLWAALPGNMPYYAVLDQ